MPTREVCTFCSPFVFTSYLILFTLYILLLNEELIIIFKAPVKDGSFCIVNGKSL